MVCNYLNVMSICVRKKNISFTISMLHIFKNLLNTHVRTNFDYSKVKYLKLYDNELLDKYFKNEICSIDKKSFYCSNELNSNVTKYYDKL